MTENRFDVIVIGAGPGGASCAALLAKKGIKVLLLDQNAKAGGKAIAVVKRGYTHEMWPNQPCFRVMSASTAQAPFG